MRKMFCFISVIMLSFLMLGTDIVKADEYLVSEMVKKQARQYCGSEAYQIGEQNNEPEAVASSFVNQTATSKAGSKFIMPTGKFKRFGYCHIFTGHLERANGSIPNKIGTKTQFKYAHYPVNTMKIAMEVINLQSKLVPDGGGYYYKEIKSPTAGQVVRVVFHTTADFEGGLYSKHKYVIITMYPV